MATGRDFVPTTPERLFYPEELCRDLRNTDLPCELIDQILASAWEYVRCVVPNFTNWDRYVALVRVSAIAIVAEYRGELVDIISGDDVLGYDITELLDTLFGNGLHQDLRSEFRTALLFSAEKSSGNLQTTLFRRYTHALTRSPEDWFRIRDADGGWRLVMAAALACCDIDDNPFSEAEYRMMAEISGTLYDAVAYFKHRAEGELMNLFACVGAELRTECYRLCREALWRIDTAWANIPDRRPAVDFARLVGGPIHLTMRRYRFVEDSLTLGLPEQEAAQHVSHRNAKLWRRLEDSTTTSAEARFEKIMRDEHRLLFPGMAEMLERSSTDTCAQCARDTVEFADETGELRGNELCDPCKENWRSYLLDVHHRVSTVLG